MSTLVTVIVPVYNCEDHIEESLSSILKQTHESLELIVVDDGSTDRSMVIARRLAAVDDRVFLVDGGGLGAGGARNLGFERARGEFTYFMDGDDVLRLDAFELLVARAEETQADVVFFDYESVVDPAVRDCLSRTVRRSEGYQPGAGWALMREMRRRGDFHTAVWINFARTSHLRDNSIGCQEIDAANDVMWTIGTFLLAQKAVYLDEVLYRYRVHQNSITRGKRIATHVTARREVVRGLLSSLDDPALNDAQRSVLRSELTVWAREFVLLLYAMPRQVRRKWNSAWLFEVNDLCSELRRANVQLGAAANMASRGGPIRTALELRPAYLLVRQVLKRAKVAWGRVRCDRL